LIITQENLIKQIANEEDMDVATVRHIFKSAEDIIFDYLSSTTPSEDVIIKPFKGLNIKRKYIDKKLYSKGMFQNITCQEHISVKANLSKYYTKKINDKLF
jgi:hypothetical protein